MKGDVSMAKRENYNELYLFMQVVREGSFTAAAQRLGLAQSGVSRSVRELEERLGVQLLVRTTRKLSLTQAGEQLYQKTASGFEMLDLGLATLAHYRETPSGTVRINASQHAIDKCLLPKLAVFKQRYPDIRLELINESRFRRYHRGRFDAGVRTGPEVGEGYGRGTHHARYGDGNCGDSGTFSSLWFSANPGGFKGASLYRLSVCRRQRIPVGTQSG